MQVNGGFIEVEVLAGAIDFHLEIPSELFFFSNQDQ